MRHGQVEVSIDTVYREIDKEIAALEDSILNTTLPSYESYLKTFHERKSLRTIRYKFTELAKQLSKDED